MRIIISENKRKNVVTKWLDMDYGDLEKYSIGHRFIQYLDNDRDSLFSFNRDTGIVDLSEEITNQLVSMFGVTSGYDINDIFIPWLMERYNLHVEKIIYTTWHCNKCGRYHITKYHID
jgi:hypothetical protein